MGLPGADGEVEVVGAIAGGGGFGNRTSAQGRGALSVRWEGPQLGEKRNNGDDECLDKIVHTNKL